MRCTFVSSRCAITTNLDILPPTTMNSTGLAFHSSSIVGSALCRSRATHIISTLFVTFLDSIHNRVFQSGGGSICHRKPSCGIELPLFRMRCRRISAQLRRRSFSTSDVINRAAIVAYTENGDVSDVIVSNRRWPLNWWLVISNIDGQRSYSY